MALVNRSMADAVSYVKKMLGAPIINVELHDTQIQQCVYDAVQLFNRYMYGEGAYEDVIIIDLKEGQRSYPMPDDVVDTCEINIESGASGINKLFSMTNQVFVQSGMLGGISGNGFGGGQSTMGVTSLSSGATSMGLEMSEYDIATKYLELTKRYFSKTYVVNYHPLRKEMVVEPTPKIDSKGVLIVWRKEALEDCVEHPLVKKLMLAKSRQLWGTLLGKYSLTLPGGGSITGDQLKSDGLAEEEKVMTDMEEEQEPLGFWVG